jgi:hypothetical protein
MLLFQLTNGPMQVLPAEPELAVLSRQPPCQVQEVLAWQQHQQHQQ